MKNILKSWKTSLIGGGALTNGIMTFVETGNIKAAIPMLLMGILGLFAKDSNVSGTNTNP